MSRRAAIAMTPAEVEAFLAEERVLTVATIGRDGWPHLMPLWYVVRDGECWAWTYAKSQKVRNLERDSRCTLQVEAGSSYLELRGVMMKAACAIHRDLSVVVRASGTSWRSATAAPTATWTSAQAAKRVALQFVMSHVASFDHRKLA